MITPFSSSACRRDADSCLYSVSNACLSTRTIDGRPFRTSSRLRSSGCSILGILRLRRRYNLLQLMSSICLLSSGRVLLNASIFSSRKLRLSCRIFMRGVRLSSKGDRGYRRKAFRSCCRRCRIWSRSARAAMAGGAGKV